MTAKIHHYVPQCYLKGFARHRDEPKLFVIDGNEQRSFVTNPKNVASEQHFHRIDAEGYPPDALESAFGNFEGELGPALERIIEARSLKNENDRAYLLNLMALIAVKNPRQRENFRSFHEAVAKRIMDLATATSERWESQIRRAKANGLVAKDAAVSYEEMRAFVEKDEFKIETTTDYHLKLEMQSFETVLPYFVHRNWVLFRAPKGKTGFVTSDHPVCLMWTDPAERGRFHGPGHGLLGTQIVFPVSNELALIGAFEAREDEIDANELRIAQINGTVIVHARRQIYARHSDFLYKLHHNRKIMRGSELLKDKECARGQRR